MIIAKGMKKDKQRPLRRRETLAPGAQKRKQGTTFYKR